MKTGFWVQLIFIVFEVSVLLTPSECFTIPISVSTGMAIIMALVKVKAVIVKVILGLKAMGYETLVWRTSRRKRSTVLMPPVVGKGSSMSLHQQDELIAAWNDLQQTVGKVIDFDLESCLSATMSRNFIVNDGVDVNQSSKLNTDNKEYSTWVSKILGSSTKDPLACHILKSSLEEASNK